MLQAIRNARKNMAIRYGGRIMMQEDKIMVGLLGTSVSAVGAGLSVTELQAIISIIVTVAGFIISVLIPLLAKLYNKIMSAKKDGKIDKEEMKDIVSTGKEILDETKKVIDEVKNKTYRNLQQQVKENMENIAELQDLKLVGIDVAGIVADYSSLPSSAEQGQVYAVGSASPYELYVYNDSS